MDEDALTRAIIPGSRTGLWLPEDQQRAAEQRILEKLGKDRVQRIWRREGLKVHAKTKAF